MSLEALLKPIQWLDEQVLRYYTKKAEAWEEKGKSKYSLAHLYNLSGSGANLIFMLQGDMYFSLGTGLLAVQSLDFARNAMGARYEAGTASSTVAKAPKAYEAIKKISAMARLPKLVTGAGFMIKGIVSFIEYIQTKNPEALTEAAYLCSFGYALAGTASSMYVKDGDPKLLEKKPVEEINLQLQPVPVRTKNHEA